VFDCLKHPLRRPNIDTSANGQILKKYIAFDFRQCHISTLLRAGLIKSQRVQVTSVKDAIVGQLEPTAAAVDLRAGIDEHSGGAADGERLLFVGEGASRGLIGLVKDLLENLASTRIACIPYTLAQTRKEVEKRERDRLRRGRT
jgi:hypothetical protein